MQQLRSRTRPRPLRAFILLFLIFPNCLQVVQGQDFLSLLSSLGKVSSQTRNGGSARWSDLIRLGQNAARLGQALQEGNKKTAPTTTLPPPIIPKVNKPIQILRDGPAAPAPAPPSNLLPFEEEPLIKLLRAKQGNPSRQSAPRSATPLMRITERFGQNFFHMIDELQEYTGPNAKIIPTGVSGIPAPAPIGSTGGGIQGIVSDTPTLPNTPADFLSAHNLMVAFLKATSKDPKKDLRPMPAMNDGTEAGKNRPIMDQLFESDILLTSKQMKAIVLAEAESKQRGRRRAKRKVITGAVYRWSKGHPIAFVWGHHDKDWQDTIRKGLAMWERETCLRFAENGFGKDKIEFFRGSGCYSSVGKVGGKQKISIGYGCDDAGIVSHEVGHSLGFWHEQSRYDRDQYISLNERYVAGGTEGNFAKRSDLEIDGMGLPYDLGSVMHYGPQAFTTDWEENTIKTRDKKYQHTIGQRYSPSFIDVKQINRLYCNDVCKDNALDCFNDGYPDPNNCGVCKCPPGFGGKLCGRVEQTPCGEELKAIPDLWQHLTHTGKDRCVWRIRAPGARIRFILDTAKYQCDSTCKSFVEIKHNSDFQQIGFRSCCDEKDVEVVSDQDEIIIIADARSLTDRDGTFALRYVADSGAPLPKPPPPVWIPGRENRAFRGVSGKGGVIERFILNALPYVRDPSKPVETTFSIVTDYFASSLLGASRDKKR